MTPPTTDSSYVAGPTTDLVDRGLGYVLQATQNQPEGMPGTVCVYVRREDMGQAMHLFITPADARALAAQLVAAADAIDTEGASR